MEIIGLILMGILITLSNAGGLSGAGSNIPIMLIFFNMEMSEAVPISAFVAVCATLLRFLLNFNQKHPKNPNRLSINYEVVILVMPAVFLGSLIGVKLGILIGQTAQVIIFGITVAWSIQTTAKKAAQMIKQERQSESLKENLINDSEQTAEKNPLLDNEKEVSEAAKTPELDWITTQEASHFPCNRLLYTVLSFLSLYIAQALTGPSMTGKLSDTTVYAIYSVFALVCFGLTLYALKLVSWIQDIKVRDGYEFDANDTRFDSSKDVVLLAFFCAIAAVLCGMTGIAGGMVLGPLFLRYNMLPQVMAGTNQYITLVASFSVMLQFAYAGTLNIHYSIMFGVLTVISAFCGIHLVNIYVAKSGK